MLFDEAGGARKRKDTQAARQVGVCLEVPTETFFWHTENQTFYKTKLSRFCFRVFFCLSLVILICVVSSGINF